MPLVEQHDGSSPDTCEVCRYLQLHPLVDRRLAHTLTMLAGWTLIENLESVGSPLPLRGIYTERFAADSPGQAAPLEPEHWTLALLAAPEVRLTIETATTEATQ